MGEGFSLIAPLFLDQRLVGERRAADNCAPVFPFSFEYPGIVRRSSSWLCQLKAKVTQSRMIIGTAAKRPKIPAIRFLDGKIVDARES